MARKEEQLVRSSMGSKEIQLEVESSTQNEYIQSRKNNSNKQDNREI